MGTVWVKSGWKGKDGRSAPGLEHVGEGGGRGVMRGNGEMGISSGTWGIHLYV